MNKTIVLNAPVVTAAGTYKYRLISHSEALEIVAKSDELVSAIGHSSTAAVLTKLLKTEISVNRISVTQEIDCVAIVFRLKQRVPEGVVLDVEELERIGYEFGLLERID
ncbi:MAG: STIV orfB116 family protein [Pyrinomonadaceae bacterium]